MGRGGEGCQETGERRISPSQHHQGEELWNQTHMLLLKVSRIHLVTSIRRLEGRVQSKSGGRVGIWATFGSTGVSEAIFLAPAWCLPRQLSKRRSLFPWNFGKPRSSPGSTDWRFLPHPTPHHSHPVFFIERIDGLFLRYPLLL